MTGQTHSIRGGPCVRPRRRGCFLEERGAQVPGGSLGSCVDARATTGHDAGRGVLHVTDQEHPVRGGWAGRAPGRGRGWEERGAQAPSSPPPTPARPRWAAVGDGDGGGVTRYGARKFHSRSLGGAPTPTGLFCGRAGRAGPRRPPWGAGPRTDHDGPRRQGQGKERRQDEEGEHGVDAVHTWAAPAPVRFGAGLGDHGAGLAFLLGESPACHAGGAPSRNAKPAPWSTKPAAR